MPPMVTKEKNWRMIDLSYGSPSMNLALEESLARTATQIEFLPIVRFWVDPKAVVVGRYQEASAEVDIVKCSQHGVEVARRFTGGGAVFHDEGTLNFTVITKRSEPLSSLKFHERSLRLVQESLRRFGINSSVCDINSLVVNGRKLCGAAASLGRNFAFWHCSILVSTDTRLLETVLAPSKVTLVTQFVRSRWRPVTTIAEALSKPVTIGDVKSRLITCVESLLEVRLEAGRLSAREEEYSRKLFAGKYSSQDWNLKGNRLQWNGKERVE